MTENMNEDNFGTGWENEPDLMELKADYTSAQSTHDSHISRVESWLKKLHIKSGDVVNEEGRSKVCPKTIRRNNEWRYTSLTEPFLNTHDIFNAFPVTAEDVEAAKQNGMMLNNQFNTKLNKVNFIDRYVRKCVDEGTAIVRVGWKYESKIHELEFPEYEIRPTEDPKHHAELDRASNADPATLPPEMLQALMTSNERGTPHYPVEVGTVTEKEEIILANHPTVTVCDIENVVIDPSCNGILEDAQFIIYSFETSMSDLEKAGIYSNLDEIEDNLPDPIADSEHSSKWAESGFSFSDEPRKKFVAREYWGYWDIDGSGMTTPIVATWVGNTLIRMEENPYPDKTLPFVAVSYLPVDGSVYGEPDCELIEDNQAIIGALTRGMIDLMGKSANSQTGVRKGALDVINKRKFDNGEDYEFNDAGDAQNSIYQHTFPEISMSAYNLLGMQNQEAEALTGVKAFAEGITGAGLGDTATHARGALDAAARRELGILRRIAYGMKQIGHKIIAMNQVFLSEEEVIRVTNEDFVTIRRDDLTGKIDIRLDISTAEADEQKAAELSFMLQTTGQQFGLEMYQMILAEIAALRKMPELAQRIREYKPQPDPMRELELEEKRIELQLAQAEVAKVQAETQKILAEAGNKSADTDKKNLEYMEQEQGVNHAREVEKQGAQARSNMELEAFKHELAKDTPPQQTSSQSE